MSSAPSFGLMIGLPLCGKLADFVHSKKYLSTRSVRVLFETFSMIIPAGLLAAIGFLRCDHTILITSFLFLSGIAISLTSGVALVNSNDIAPSYVGIIFGIANTFAAASGSISSLSAKALTPNDTQEEWQIVFALCAAICVSGAIIFAIMARGEIQEWARSQETGSCGNVADVNINTIA
ncbi:sialin-like [Octopus bimaculoides]|nr:sialin-like [Octopus bimaculoides]